ncbi:DgyrCDS2794 [Dimorphilus gyrociliatus]|uniref:DgyrCDS2794 n=1 Tax=Dimorphilus gyrociliatus TaxID=2664684 RepID=A0A7I8VCK4_9ANNE|nr:DgyrCDS2794 [Dimorphilus gyrociliatus]
MATPRNIEKKNHDINQAQENKDESNRNVKDKSSSAESSTGAVMIIACIFVASAFALFLVYMYSPNLEENEKKYIRVPTNIDDAKELGKILSRYKRRYYYQVLFGYFISYIFLQSFAIPGSIFLSILSGFLFPFPLALFLVCLCSGIGASFCYLLSYLVGKRLVNKYLPQKTAEWSRIIERQKDNLLHYIIFLRITPFLPNWFINITSPVLNVPLSIFFIGTFIGVAPPSFVAIHAGTMLHKLTSSSDAISYKSIGVLAVFAIASLLPILFKHRLKAKFN